MAFTMTTDARAEGVTTRRQLPGAKLIKKAGMGAATALLAVGLFVGAGAGGASAAPLDAQVASPAPVVQAATTSASYYSPTIAVPSYVASGDDIAIGGAGFDAYDAVSVYLVDGYGDVISSGTAYTDRYGAISGVLHTPYETPGAYSVVAIDGYGTVVTVGLWITY